MPGIRELESNFNEPITTTLATSFARAREIEAPLMGLLVSACRIRAEAISGLKLASRDFVLTFDREELMERCWPRRARWFSDIQEVSWRPFPLDLAIHPVTAVVSVKVFDPFDGETDVPAGDYALDQGVRPARLRLSSDALLSYSLRETAAIVVQVTAGYATCPADLQLDILRMVATSYEHREDIVTGTVAVKVPNDVMQSLQSRALVKL